MRYCKECGVFFDEAGLLDDGLQDDRFPDANGNRVYVECCPRCQSEDIDEIPCDGFVVTDNEANYAYIAYGAEDIVDGIKALMHQQVDLDDIVVYRADEIDDGARFGVIL